MGNDQFDLSGKVAIVVGGTEGMGAAIAEQFAASGARVTVNSRTAAGAEAFAGRLNDSHARGEPVARAAPGDMTDKAVLQEVVDSTVATFGKLTTLVLSASIRPWFGPSIAMPDDELDTHFLSMFKCRFWMTTLCIPHMVGAGGGSVVYIGSGSPFEATSERSVASCMRAAEVQMVKNFAAEFGADNVRFNIIAPSLIDAHGSRALFADGATVASIAAGLPMRRSGEVSEIAAAATFLASDASSFTTGAVLPVDGGRLIHAVPNRLGQAFAAEQATRRGDR
jgi:NAD(P)-dependent dehydrogenase (short-subunit alcohol dehydrogenase family)